MTLILSEQVTSTGFSIMVRTPDHLADVDVEGRRLGAFTLSPEWPGVCMRHGLSTIVGYVVFGNDPHPRHVARTDVAVFVGAGSYGAALACKHEDPAPFGRGIGTLYACGHRSY